MRITKKADGKMSVEMSEAEWNSIGNSNGWFRNDPSLVKAAANRITKEAEEVDTGEDAALRDTPAQPRKSHMGKEQFIAMKERLSALLRGNEE